MSSSQSSPATPAGTITLDSTLEEHFDKNDSNDEVNLETTMDTTEVIFDETLAPGVAPPGFILIDEDRQPQKPVLKKNNEIKPVFKVVFRDHSTFRSYHRKVESFLKELITSRSSRKNVVSSLEDLVLEIFDSKNESRDVSELDSSITIIEDKHPNDSLFTIEKEPKIQDDLDIPMYGKKFTGLENSNDNVDMKEDCGPKMSCFNCMGNHSLRDCDQPRNYTNINKNRKKYVVKRGPTNARYHLEDDQKYGHFIPGQISSNLRRALGLMDDELPRHIYKMRILGYPPGWLEEARLQHSGLSLFDDAGKAEIGSDEEGEIVCPGDKDKYDIKKIIDFPGFNVSTPEGIHDDDMEYWGSSVQIQCSKSTLVSYLNHKRADDGYKRKKMPNPANTIVRTDINPGEMEIDQIDEDTSVECVPVKNLFIPPLPKHEEPDLPPPPPVSEDLDSSLQDDVPIQLNDESTATMTRNDSPSLVDLETKQKQLLAELDGSSSQSNADIAKTAISNLSSTEVGTSESEARKAHETDLNEVNVNKSTPKMSSECAHKSVKSVHLGTPILKSNSPFRKLPTSEKFSKNICDVINFENLPDATGKYDKISELLQKVRSAVAEIQKE